MPLLLTSDISALLNELTDYLRPERLAVCRFGPKLSLGLSAFDYVYPKLRLV